MSIYIIRCNCTLLLINAINTSIIDLFSLVINKWGLKYDKGRCTELISEP